MARTAGVPEPIERCVREDRAPVDGRFLAGRDASATVLRNQGPDGSVTASDAAAPGGSAPEQSVAFAGDETVRVRVPPGIPELAARLLSGTGSRYLTRVLAWTD